MTLTPTIQATLQRHQEEIQQALRQAIQRHSRNPLSTGEAELGAFYGQMRYHLGWVDSSFTPIAVINPGKLLRPTLLLLAYEAAGARGLANSIEENNNYLRCALPAAAALELTHNFTLIHDDIVDNDTERHHQPTLWSIWGTSQGINTGDGMFALARLTMWDILSEGVEGEVAAHLGAVLDRACLIVAEGQYLDLSFERRQDISVAMYLDMITRKTAALMSCATEMGAQLGTHDSATIESLRKFGYEIGVAFQVRDDVLGVWASASETGKTSAGDIYRRKRSLPFLHALENAGEQDKHTLQKLYNQEIPLTAEQAAMVLDIFEYTHTRTYCIDFLRQKCSQARLAFERIPRLHNETAKRALDDLETIILFVEATIEL